MVDDHELVRLGFVQLLESEPDIKVECHVQSIALLLEWLSENSVDIIITDLSLQDESGYTLLDTIMEKNIPVKPIVLSMHDAEANVARALEKGARGYLSKTSAPEELTNAITAVHEGRIFLSQSVIESLEFAQTNDELIAIKNLTEREQQVFDCLAKGMEVKHIAQELDIATKTVHVHRTNVLSKLGVFTTFELTKIALKNSLITPECLYK